MKLSWAVFVTLPILFVCFLAGGGLNPSPAWADHIKIGFSGSLTGGTFDYGQAAKRGFELAIKEYNEKGGYQGHPVVGVIYDDETQPAKGVQNTTRLVTLDKVIGVIGPVNSGVALATIDITQRYQIPHIISIATAVPLTQRYKSAPKNYIFHLSLVDSAQIALMIDYVKKKGCQRVGMMNDTTGWGESGRQEALKQLKENGIELATEIQRFAVGDTDMTAQLAKLKEANVDCLISFALAPEAVQILKSMDKLGYRIPLVDTWALLAPSFLKLGGKDLIEGAVTVSSYTIELSERSRAFHEKVVAEYGEDFYPIATAQTYDATRIMLRALDKVGPDPKKMRDAIEDMDDFTDAVTAISPKPYSKEDHEALGPGKGFLMTYRNGELVRLEP